MAWEQHQFIMGGGFLLWEASKTFRNHFALLAWEQHQFIMGGGFLLWEASKTFRNHFALLAWEQHQFIMGGGFFILGGLKNFSQSLWIIDLGTAPVYYGRRIFYDGRPQKFFRRTLHFWPGNSTSLLWEEEFLLWEASKTFHNHFGLLTWEQHQFIMGGGFFIMGGLKNLSQSLWIIGLGTAPVYYGRSIFYYGRPQKLFTITLDY